MTNCLDFRRRVGAEPFADGADIAAHRRECAACAHYQDELQSMDGLIARALAVDPARIGVAKTVARFPAPARRRLFAIAASLVVGLSVGFVLLVSAPRASIAREVIEHMMHEPGAMAARVPIAPDALAGVLDPDGTRLLPGAGDVTYAARCPFGGHVVPHLVVQTSEGPVTVLLLLHRDLRRPLPIDAEGFRGVVLPAPRGSIAIVGEAIADPEDVARRVFDAVDWGG